MAFCITFGSTEFTSQLKGYEGVTAQCRNCGNWSAHCITRWPWFTVCFIPLIPLATHKYKEIACPVCHFCQDLKDRPDVQNMQGNNGGPPPGHNQQGYNQQGPPQDWNQGPPPSYGGQQGPKPQYH